MADQQTTKTTGKFFGFIQPEDGGSTYGITVDKREMIQENVDEFDEITKVVFDLQPVLFAYEINRRNYSEIGDELKRCFQSMTPAENIAQRFHHVPEVDLYLGPAQKIGNMLASSYAFLSNAEQDLISRFGASSPELSQWNNFRRQRHLQSFAYRLLYNLRNFTQHQSLPINGVNARAEHLLDDDEIEIEFDIYIDRDALLNARGNYLNQNCSDLQKMPARFSLTPLVHEYFVELRAICKSFIEIDAERLNHCKHYLQTLARVFKWPDECVPVIFNGLPKKTHLQEASDFDIEIKGDVSLIPVKQFQLIKSLYDVLSVAG